MRREKQAMPISHVSLRMLYTAQEGFKIKMNKNQKNLKENNSLLDTELPLRGEALKQATSTLAAEIQTKIIKSQSGVGTFFDNGFLGLFKELSQLNQDLSWEEGVKQLRGIRGIQLRLVLPRLRHFLNQRRQGRFVDF
jgi:hypothetical protein